jgi:ribosomal protein S18 acetylase RimI-like enzyme
MRVRPVTEADYAAAGEVCVAAYRADGQLTAEDSYTAVLADVASRAAHGDVLVAHDDTTGAIVGCVTFVLPGSRYAEISQPGEGEFRMLAVDPRAQGRGVGSALVHACLDRAVSLGCRAVAICTRDFNETAFRLYRKFGFVRVPERDWSPRPDVNLAALRVELPVPAT